MRVDKDHSITKAISGTAQEQAANMTVINPNGTVKGWAAARPVTIVVVGAGHRGQVSLLRHTQRLLLVRLCERWQCFDCVL
jgi:hypothetical protein